MIKEGDINKMKTIQTLVILTILILTTPLILSHITPEDVTINEVDNIIKNTYTHTSTQVIHVYNNQSIQEAINNSNPGDTIYIHNGTYHEHIIVNKSLRIIGENKENTIIDGDNEWDAIILLSNSNIYLSNIMVTNQSRDSWMGGIDISEGFWAPPKRKEIRNVTIYNCIVENCSDGIRCTNTTNIKITNCIIHNNVGPSIYVIDSTDIIIDNCTVYRNGYEEWCGGITIDRKDESPNIYRGSIIVRNCRIYENICYGIEVSSSTNNVRLTNITIYNNVITDNSGNGIDIRRTTNTIVYHNIITGHIWTEETPFATGIYLVDCINTIIEKNNISNNYFGIKISTSPYNPRLPDYTIKNNNLINNQKQATFLYVFPQGLLEKTTWNQNYWDKQNNKQRIKTILGYLAILNKRHNTILAIIPYLDFDKQPAEKPYNINID